MAEALLTPVQPIEPPDNVKQLVTGYIEADNEVRLFHRLWEMRRHKRDEYEARLLRAVEGTDIREIHVADGELHMSTESKTSHITRSFLEQQIMRIFADADQPNAGRYILDRVFQAHKEQHRSVVPVVVRKFARSASAT